MTAREKTTVGALAAVIAINVAVAAWIGLDTDETNPLAYLGFAIPVAVLAWWAYRILARAGLRARSAQAELRGKVRVLSANELFGGVASINNQPLLKLDLELDVPGHPTRRFTRRMVVPRLAVPAAMAGETFDAAVDPRNPSRFEISW